MEIKHHKIVLNALKQLLIKLPKNKFIEPSEFLFGATIGEHFRHIVEFYQCCLNSKGNTSLNYDLRKRNLEMESNPKYGLIILNSLLEEIENLSDVKNTKTIHLSASFEPNELDSAESSFFRELTYCLDHCIHHQALIKISLKQFGYLDLVDRNFGVAFSTQRYRDQCAS